MGQQCREVDVVWLRVVCSKWWFYLMVCCQCWRMAFLVSYDPDQVKYMVDLQVWVVQLFVVYEWGLKNWLPVMRSDV